LGVLHCSVFAQLLFFQVFGNVTSRIPEFSISDKVVLPCLICLQAVHSVTLFCRSMTCFLPAVRSSHPGSFAIFNILRSNALLINLISFCRIAREDIREIRRGPPIRV
jgi:hypothetical protein